jgi:choline dehydrogenase
MNFDFIIVGGGSAGCVLANRLSENGLYKILLLEAGKKGNIWSSVPISFATLMNNPKANWLYRSEPDEGSNFRRIEIPRGKLIGGSSSINGMVFVRGQSHDYDHWAQLGNPGWSFQEVLPFFKKMEASNFGNDNFRGRNGPLHVIQPEEKGPLYDAMFAAAREIGIPKNGDYNGEFQDGVAMTQATISRGKRQSTAVAYLNPARNRKNLTILTDSYATKLILKDKRCIGIEYLKNNTTYKLLAKKEVIVCSGTINSPQLLELSGIGDAEIIKNKGIAVEHNLPGVGKNLRDHYAPRMKWAIQKKGYTYNDKARGLGLIWQAAQYIFFRKGFLSLPAAPMRAYIRSREGLLSPDIGISVNPFLITDGVKLAKESGFTMAVHVLRSESTGTIHIRNSNPLTPPEIKFNFLSNQADCSTLLKGMRVVRDWIQSDAMKDIAGAELAPGKNINSDEDFLDWVRDNAETTYHPVGTCKMGTDSNSVVDDQLKVHGIRGLRIVDASIMPTLTSGNTNAPTIMIAEKASSMILEANS